MPEQSTPLDPELAALIHDFDHHSPEYVRRYRDVFEYMHKLPSPTLRSERYGGFWLFVRYQSLLEIQRRQDIFSNKQITIPESAAPPLIPAFEDPPGHFDYRKVIASAFSPVAMAGRAARIAEMTQDLFDRVANAAEFDVVLDIAQPLTGRLTMEVLGLNPDEFNEYAQPIHNATFDHGDHEERVAGFLGVLARVKRDVAEQRDRPKGVIGEFLNADFQGRKLTDAEIEAITLNLLIGGLGTTQGFVGSAVVYLGRNLDQRQLLIDEPELLATTALDELLRFLSPVQTQAKLATKDYVIDGVLVKKGEMVLLGYGAANIDPGEFENPLKVDFRRRKNRIMTFGIGPHRCLGSHMARAIIRASLSKLLEVAPRYQLIEERLEPAKSIAHIMGYRSVPIRP